MHEFTLTYYIVIFRDETCSAGEEFYSPRNELGKMLKYITLIKYLNIFLSQEHFGNVGIL